MLSQLSTTKQNPLLHTHPRLVESLGCPWGLRLSTDSLWGFCGASVGRPWDVREASVGSPQTAHSNPADHPPPPSILPNIFNQTNSLLHTPPPPSETSPPLRVLVAFRVGVQRSRQVLAVLRWSVLRIPSDLQYFRFRYCEYSLYSTYRFRVLYGGYGNSRYFFRRYCEYGENIFTMGGILGVLSV